MSLKPTVAKVEIYHSLQIFSATTIKIRSTASRNFTQINYRLEEFEQVAHKCEEKTGIVECEIINHNNML